ncbi:Uncharacterised protein [Bordetella trematum]|nr:Uncharacterised protein [Bordetella trematum]
MQRLRQCHGLAERLRLLPAHRKVQEDHGRLKRGQKRRQCALVRRRLAPEPLLRAQPLREQALQFGIYREKKKIHRTAPPPAHSLACVSIALTVR